MFVYAPWEWRPLGVAARDQSTIPVHFKLLCSVELPSPYCDVHNCGITTIRLHSFRLRHFVYRHSPTDTSPTMTGGGLWLIVLLFVKIKLNTKTICKGTEFYKQSIKIAVIQKVKIWLKNMVKTSAVLTTGQTGHWPGPPSCRGPELQAAVISLLLNFAVKILIGALPLIWL